MRAINYSEARNRLASVLDDVINDIEPTIITRRGDGSGDRAVVMVPLASYNSMQETAYLLRGKNREHLMTSIAELESGKAKPRRLSEDAAR
jgi:antitoxin YefM